MKIVNLLPLLLLYLFVSCNNNPEPEDPWVYVPIAEVLEPECEFFPIVDGKLDLGDKMPKPEYVINSPEDFPEGDILGMEKLKKANINFDRYTLLIVYVLYADAIKDCKPSLYKLASSETYRLSTLFIVGSEEKVWSLYMCPVLIDKIPVDSEVEFWNSFSSENI